MRERHAHSADEQPRVVRLAQVAIVVHRTSNPVKLTGERAPPRGTAGRPRGWQRTSIASTPAGRTLPAPDPPAVPLLGDVARRPREALDECGSQGPTRRTAPAGRGSSARAAYCRILTVSILDSSSKNQPQLVYINIACRCSSRSFSTSVRFRPAPGSGTRAGRGRTIPARPRLALEHDPDVTVACRPRVPHVARVRPLEARRQPVAQPIERLAQRLAPALPPAVVQLRRAAAVGPPAFHAVRAAPRAVLANARLDGPAETAPAARRSWSAAPRRRRRWSAARRPGPCRRGRGGGRRSRRRWRRAPAADAGVVVSGRPSRGAGRTWSPVRRAVRSKATARDTLAIVEKDVDRSCPTGRLDTVGPRGCRSGCSFGRRPRSRFRVGRTLAGPGLGDSQDREPDPVLGQNSRLSTIDGGLGKPHPLRPPAEAVLEVVDAPEHLGPTLSRALHSGRIGVAVDLGQRRAVPRKCSRRALPVRRGSLGRSPASPRLEPAPAGSDRS